MKFSIKHRMKKRRDLQNAQFYKSLLEYNPDAICAYGIDGDLIHANPAAERITGYTVDELHELKLLTLIPPEYQQMINKDLESALHGTGEESEIAIISKKGVRINLITKIVPAVTNDKIVGVHVIFKDITDRKRAEEALRIAQQDLQATLMERKQMLEELRSTKEQLESFIKYTTDAITVVDREYNVVQINSAFEKMFGWSSQEIIGDRLTFFPKGFFHENEGLRQTITCGGMVSDYQTKRQRKDGSLIDVSITISPIRDSRGKLVFFATIIRDITDRKKVERELIEAEEKYRNLVEEALVGVYVIQNNRFVYVNPRFSEILGYPQEDIIGNDINFWVRPESLSTTRRNVRKRMVGRIRSMQYQIKGQRKDGSEFLVEVHGTRTIYNGKPALIGTAVDVTERAKNEELLRKADKLKIVGQLAAGVAHEIRNPLTTLKGFIQFFKDRIDDEHLVGVMLSELDRINFIVSEFLVLAKPQAIHFQSNNIRELLQQIVSFFDAQTNLNNIQIRTLFHEDVPCIKSEQNQLKQVFANIIKNAIESMSQGGEITILLKRLTPNNILIRFSDQGCGIPRDRIPKLGEPFYTTKEKGTGLGLMVSYKIIEEHQGKIYINSQMGKGTTVDIILPIHLKDEAE